MAGAGTFTNRYSTLGNLNVNLAEGTISGGNAAAGLTGDAVPSSADYIGFEDGSGNLVGVSSGNPLPITGSISASNPSVGTLGSTAPTSGTFLAASDGTNLQGLLVESSSELNLRIAIYQGANEATVTAGNALKVDASATTVPVSGTFWQATQPVSGTFWQATQPVSGTVTAAQATAASLNATVVGTGTFVTQATLAAETTKVIGTVRTVGNAGAAFDAVCDGAHAPPANAIQVGAVAATALPTAYTATDLVPLMTDKYGRVIVLQGAMRELTSGFATQQTDTSSHSLIAAAGSGIYADISLLVITNGSNQQTEISISDGTATYKYQIAAYGGAVMPFNPPLAAASTNTAWTCVSSASANMDYSGNFVKNK